MKAAAATPSHPGTGSAASHAWDKPHEYGSPPG
jgi:hypothetical protein